MSDEINIKTKSSKTKLFIIIAAIAVVVLTVGAVVLLTSKGGTAKNVEKQLSLGAKYLSELDYEQAIAVYEAVIEIDPKSTDAYLGLAEVYIAMGELEMAEEVLEEAKDAVEGENLRKIEEKLDEVKQKKEAAEQPVATPTPMPTATPTPTPKPTATPTPIPTAVPKSVDEILDELSRAKVGEYVTFGRYEQDNVEANGPDPIAWRVLEVTDNKVLLISRDVLARREFGKSDEVWADCSLRTWLNYDFYEEAFDTSEKKFVLVSDVKTEDNVYCGRDGGPDSKDKVFILSIEESEKYFAEPRLDSYGYIRDNRDLAARASEYLIEKENIYVSNNGEWYSKNVAYVLRDPASILREAYTVGSDGTISSYDEKMDKLGVRPMVWVSLNPLTEEAKLPEPTPKPEPTPIPEKSPEQIWEEKYDAGEFPTDVAWIDDLYQKLVTDDYRGVIEILKDDSIAEKVKPYLYYEYAYYASGYLLVTSDNKIVGVQLANDISAYMERYAWYAPNGSCYGIFDTVYGDKEVIYYPEYNSDRRYDYIWFDGETAHYSDGKTSEYEENQCFSIREF